MCSNNYSLCFVLFFSQTGGGEVDENPSGWYSQDRQQWSNSCKFHKIKFWFVLQCSTLQNNKVSIMSNVKYGMVFIYCFFFVVFVSSHALVFCKWFFFVLLCVSLICNLQWFVPLIFVWPNSQQADIVVLTTSEENGLCYIDTAELDGWVNKKIHWYIWFKYINIMH